MAAITVDPKVVRPVRFNQVNLRHRMSNAAIERGTVIVENSSGKWVAGNGATNSQRVSIALHKANSANIPLTGLAGPGSLVDVGDGLPAIGSIVYATATGTLDDVVTSNRRIGEVVMGPGGEVGATPRKLLMLD